MEKSEFEEAFEKELNSDRNLFIEELIEKSQVEDVLISKFRRDIEERF